jgi:hypothetical protein
MPAAPKWDFVSVGDYLVFEQDTVAALVHQRKEGVDSGFHRGIIVGLDAVIALPELGTELRLADVYEGVEFMGRSE